MTETTKIEVYDDKYTVLHENGANLRALRHGEPWNRDLTGDGLVLALCQEIEQLRANDARYRAWRHAATNDMREFLNAGMEYQQTQFQDPDSPSEEEFDAGVDYAIKKAGIEV